MLRRIFYAVSLTALVLPARDQTRCVAISVNRTCKAGRTGAKSAKIVFF
ncbi:hypothetical protein HMPREF0208_03067 [Citrobacter koseri]|nr:hypothetical protein HMPREF0208_03067 [Citrobacter koseri]